MSAQTLVTTREGGTTDRYEAAARRRTRLFSSPWKMWGALALVALAVVFPLSVGDPFTISLLTTIGIFSVGAIGLNVVNRYAGQISMAQPAFLAVGAFTAVGVGAQLDLPLPLWLLASAVTGGLAGLIVAPSALRLKGVYQIVLGLGLIYIAAFAFVNWRTLTGGNVGISAPVNMSVGFLDFGKLQLGGLQYSYQQGLFIVVWLVVAVCMYLVHALMTSTAGRRIVALRDAELAARVVGINPRRSLIGAHVLASALGGVAGALYIAQLRYASIEQFGLDMALEFVIIVTIGGLASTWGPIVGSAVICAIPLLAGKFAYLMPFLKPDSAAPDGRWGIPAGQFSIVVYGVMLILILLFQPEGLTALGRRAGRAIARSLKRGSKDAEAHA
jgi:branched-chain amino acid transport system permease protein